MKKILLATTAIAGVALFANAAAAEVKLNLGGYFAGYGVYSDNDEPAGSSLREFDLRRDTEVHVSGETTLDNGLTVGFHTEQNLGGTANTDEVYGYFSGSWGRVNLGSEDGTAYLLQVAAPSADSNIDGLRNYIQALNEFTGADGAGPVAGSGFGTSATILGLSGDGRYNYDHVSDVGGSNTDRISYLTPKFNGFQAGVSFAPEQGQNTETNGYAAMAADNTVGEYEDIWEAGVRWDGEFQGFGLSLGGGYSNASLEQVGGNATATLNEANDELAPTISDDQTGWNVGANLAWNAFSFGAAYLVEETEQTDIIEVTDGSTVFARRALDVTRDTWVVGLGYDNGPWHLGASYLNQQTERDASGAAGDDGEVAAVDAEFDRVTVGAGYTFGPGMTFRGAVAFGQQDRNALAQDVGGSDGLSDAVVDRDFTQVTIGTDIQF